MQQHRPYPRGKSRWRNANREIPESASLILYSLAESLDESDDFAVSYLKSEYLSKYCDESLVPAAERRLNAVLKWASQEEKNQVTNTRFRERDPGFNILPRVTYSHFLRIARRTIQDILGPLKDKVVLGGFTGGASTSRRRTESTPAHKFSGKADVTSTAEPYIDIIYREGTLLKQFGIFDRFNTVEGAELFTVPKKTDIDRCACKEPDINMYLQKGVGRHIRQRLRRFGINLNDQGINRRMAYEGSWASNLATIDLSSASDSVTIECVRALLPSDWFLYLNDIRSQSVLVEGEYYRTEMFSSMGNGFTFELESLLFYSLCRTVQYFENYQGSVSVYGDDIIIPSGMYDLTSFVLSEFGFAVNEEKSHHKGPFRESCGGHYHGGEDVTPFYLKRKASRLTDVIRVANQLRKWAFADLSRQHRHPALYKTWLKIALLVPRDLWGGYDYELDTQLVAPVPPNKHLVRLSRKQVIPDCGAYLHWHNSNWARTIEPELSGFDPQATDSICRMRSVRSGAPLYKEYFREEISLHTGPYR